MKADVIIFVLMAVFGDVPQPEVDRACEERELALERTLEEWEREIIKAHMANDRLKAATPEERLSIPDYKKVIYSRLDSLSNKLDLSLKKVSTGFSWLFRLYPCPTIPLGLAAQGSFGLVVMIVTFAMILLTVIVMVDKLEIYNDEDCRLLL